MSSSDIGSLTESEFEEVSREANALATFLEEAEGIDYSCKKPKLSGSETITILRSESKLHKETGSPIANIKRKLNSSSDFCSDDESEVASKKSRSDENNKNLQSNDNDAHDLNASSYSVSELDDMLSPLGSEKNATGSVDDKYCSLSPFKDRVGDVKQLSRALSQRGVSPLLRSHTKRSIFQKSKNSRPTSMPPAVIEHCDMTRDVAHGDTVDVTHGGTDTSLNVRQPNNVDSTVNLTATLAEKPQFKKPTSLPAAKTLLKQPALKNRSNCLTGLKPPASSCGQVRTLAKPTPVCKAVDTSVVAKSQTVSSNNDVQHSTNSGSGLKPPSKLAVSRDGLKQLAGSSKLKAPCVVNTNVPAPVSTVKKPVSKLQLVKPISAVCRQRKAAQTAAKTSGPLKATASLQMMQSKRKPVSACEASVPSQVASSGTEALSQTFTADSFDSPDRQSSNSNASFTTPSLTSSARRRSCLPTPRRGSNTSSTCGSSVSSLGSFDSFASPAPRNGCMGENSPYTPPMSRRALVQRTPLGGNKENKTASRWSPVPRPKAICLEDEAIQCTKRSSLAHVSATQRP